MLEESLLVLSQHLLTCAEGAGVVKSEEKQSSCQMSLNVVKKAAFRGVRDVMFD